MKNLLLLIIGIFFCLTDIDAKIQNGEVQQIRGEISKLKNEIIKSQSTIQQNSERINELLVNQSKLFTRLDSLSNKICILDDSVYISNDKLTKDIEGTKQTIENNNHNLASSISEKTKYGIGLLSALAMIGAFSVLYLRKRTKNNHSAIANIKDIQNKLHDTQKKLEEKSLSLGNKLIELLDKQINTSSTSEKPDHSLVLKVADEITRIELNLSRMDSSVRGYKQLSKGVERIKNNFLAKGYEIADMLGKPYNEGMRINADFVIDEELSPGSRIITSITKPQVVYKGEIIQKAIVTVSQNI